MENRSRTIGLLVLAITALVTAICASVAGAANVKHGIRPIAPKNNAVVAKGTTPTFKARVRGKGTVYFVVCKSKKRDRDGKACARKQEDIDRGKKGKKSKRGRTYTFKPERFTFPSYYLNTPGTYYWQVYRIDCVRTRSRKRLFDCIQESPIKKFRVR